MTRDRRPVTPAYLKSLGALLDGHFRLSSGLHSEQYVQCARLFRDPRQAAALGRSLACRLSGQQRPQIVVSPAMGGLFIGHEVAKALRLPHIFTERVDGIMTLRRGFTLQKGERVLIVEDVLTTGKSSREVMRVVRAHGAKPIKVLSVINRGCTAKEMGVAIDSLLHLDIKTYRPKNCPQCKKGIPAVKPGSRTVKTRKR